MTRARPLNGALSFVAAPSGAAESHLCAAPGRLEDSRANPVSAAFYRTQMGRLVRFFARRVGHDEATDMAHDAVASLMQAAARQPDRVSQPEAYLSATARNLVAKRARTAARRSVSLHIPVEAADLPGSCPIAHLEARDMLARLETAMIRLRPLTREIFMAHRLDGYTYREIAEHTGLTVKRVEKHMSRALARLDDVLGADR